MNKEKYILRFIYLNFCKCVANIIGAKEKISGFRDKFIGFNDPDLNLVITV